MINEEIRLAVLDDHFHARMGLKSVIDECMPYIHQVMVYENANDLLNQLDGLSAVLLDIKLKNNENGLAVCKEIKSMQKDMKVIMMSVCDEPLYIARAAEYGADGYLSKSCEIKELDLALHKVILEGKKYFSPKSKEMMQLFQARLLHMSYDIKMSLSLREMEIIPHVCNELSNAEISKLMNCSENTVAKHRQNMMRKIDAHTSLSVYKFALRHGLVNP